MSFWTTAESDVQAFITKLQQGLTWAQTELDSALGWVVNNTPAIVTDIEKAIGFASAVGVSTNPEVAAAIVAAQAAITALNAVASAKTSGASDIQTLLAGYTAVKQAQAASASATAGTTAAVAAAVAPTP